MVGVLLENVRKSYARQSLVSSIFRAFSTRSTSDGFCLDIDRLEIAKGQRVGIIGPNGAGKSTLLHLIAGTTKAATGTLKIEGDVHAILTLGEVLKPELTGAENIQLMAELRGIQNDDFERHIKRVIEISELGASIEHPVRTYSSGMAARLAFAMAVETKADILIIDEALSVGDARFLSKARGIVDDLCRQGSIAIIVSHALSAIRALCNDCIWMDGGKIVDRGDPEKITNDYVRSIERSDAAIVSRPHNETSIKMYDGLCDIWGENSSRGVHTFGPASIHFTLPNGTKTEDLRRLAFQISDVDGTVLLFGERHLENCQTDTVEATIDNFPLQPSLYILTGWIETLSKEIFDSSHFEVLSDKPVRSSKASTARIEKHLEVVVEGFESA